MNKRHESIFEFSSSCRPKFVYYSVKVGNDFVEETQTLETLVVDRLFGIEFCKNKNKMKLWKRQFIYQIIYSGWAKALYIRDGLFRSIKGWEKFFGLHVSHYDDDIIIKLCYCTGEIGYGSE